MLDVHFAAVLPLAAVPLPAGLRSVVDNQDRLGRVHHHPVGQLLVRRHGDTADVGDEFTVVEDEVLVHADHDDVHGVPGNLGVVGVHQLVQPGRARSLRGLRPVGHLQQVGTAHRLLTDRRVPPADVEEVRLGLVDLYRSRLPTASDIVLQVEGHPRASSACCGLGSG